MDNNQLVVVKHNSIVEAGYRLSIYENRILLTCIAQINSMGEIGLNDTFTVSVGDLVGLNDLDSKSTYRNLKKAVDRLFERSVTIELPNDEVLKMRWVSSIKYIAQAGMVELQFSQKIIPYISELRREFTQYRLKNVLLFKSNYSIRFYELLVKWGGNSKTVEIEWIKKQFQLEDKYTRINDLKKYVIDTAMAEINQYSDMTVSYEQIKRGRNVTAIRFDYHLKSEAKKALANSSNSKVNGVSKTEIEKLAKAGESYQQAAERINKLKDAAKGKADIKPIEKIALFTGAIDLRIESGGRTSKK